jgi:hypothetical protein
MYNLSSISQCQNTHSRGADLIFFSFISAFSVGSCFELSMTCTCNLNIYMVQSISNCRLPRTKVQRKQFKMSTVGLMPPRRRVRRVVLGGIDASDLQADRDLPPLTSGPEKM